MGRITLLFMAQNLIYFLISGFFYQKFNPMVLIPLPLGAWIIWSLGNKKLTSLKTQFLCHFLLLVPGIALNYFYMGELDKSIGGSRRLDQPFHQFDLLMLRMPVALFLDQSFSFLGEKKVYLYDFFIVSYFTYYFFPIAGVLSYIKSLKPHEWHLSARKIAHIVVFFGLNFLFYLIVPVSGPGTQYPEFFPQDPPFTALGESLFGIIDTYRTNMIDCFPSGHFGIAVLVLFWLEKIKAPGRAIFYIFGVGIFFSTLILRYHYTLDLVASIPLILVSYFLAKALCPLPIKIYQGKENP